MSSDAMTYALEHEACEKEVKGYKERAYEEWETVTVRCLAKIPWKNVNYCRCTDRLCSYEDCFARFCNTVRY